MDEADLRNAIRGALSSLDSVVEAAIRRELAEQFDLGDSERLQFEIDPFGYRIHLVQTEEDILESGLLDNALRQIPDKEESAIDWLNLFEQELFPWFVACWQAADGPRHYRPAYAFYHGGLDEPRYHLEECRWCDVTEIWRM